MLKLPSAEQTVNHFVRMAQGKANAGSLQMISNNKARGIGTGRKRKVFYKFNQIGGAGKSEQIVSPVTQGLEQAKQQILTAEQSASGKRRGIKRKRSRSVGRRVKRRRTGKRYKKKRKGKKRKKTKKTKKRRGRKKKGRPKRKVGKRRRRKKGQKKRKKDIFG